MGKWGLLVLLGMTLFSIIHLTHQLRCCTGLTSLIITKATDDDQVVNKSCTNRGTSCFNVNCSFNTCTEDLPVPDTKCNKMTTCNASWKSPTCRLLYYEKAWDTREDDDEANSEEELNINFTYFAKQDCFDNSFGDVKIGCEFHSKIFYEDHRNRLKYEKECFCNDSDLCNSNLVEICMSAEKDYIKKPEDTCYTSDVGHEAKYHFNTLVFLIIVLYCNAVL